MTTATDPKESQLYKRWFAKTDSLMTIVSAEVQSADYVPHRTEPLFMKVAATLCDSKGNTCIRYFFLRGPAVAILVILECEGVEYAVLVCENRPAVGEMFASLPAGMIEGEAVNSAGLRELEEETGIIVLSEELIDLADIFYGGTWKGIYPSPGACDEIVHILHCRKKVGRQVIDSLNGRSAGLATEGECITVQLVRLEDMCAASPTPMVHSAFVMYQSLKQKGALP